MSKQRRIIAMLVGLALGVLSFVAGAPASLAQVLPPPEGGPAPAIAPTPAVSHITYGSPIWLFVLVAAVAVVLAVAMTVAVLRRLQLRHAALLAA